MCVMRFTNLDIVGEVFERVDDLSVLGDLKVQVRAAAHAGRTGDADDLTCATYVPTLTERDDKC